MEGVAGHREEGEPGWGQIEDSVLEQMQLTARSWLEGREIWYGVIDGADSNRLIAAYPRHFPEGTQSK